MTGSTSWYDVSKSVEDLTSSVSTFINKHKGDMKAMQHRLDQFEARGNRPGIGRTAPDDSEARAERKSLEGFARTGAEFRPERSAAYSGDNDTAGGYTIAPTLSEGMTRRLFDQSPLARLARTVIVTTGDLFEEPIDADDVGAGWVGERESRVEMANADLGLLTIPCGELYSHQTITQRLLDDSRFDLGAWLEGKIQDKMGRVEGEAYIVGDGIKGKPKGLLTYPSATTKDVDRPWGTLQHVVSGSASAITADGVMSIKHKLRAPFKTGAAFLMNSTSQESVALLKDGEGRYLFNEVANTLLGFPVEIDENMPDPAAGTFPIAFGNFAVGYVRAIKPGVKFLRDPFTAKPNVIVYAYARRGGAVGNFDAIKLLKCAAA